MGNMASEGAIVSIGVNGQVQALMSSGNHGQSLETTMAQVVADHLGVDVDDVTVIQGDTASAPFGPGTGGSRSAVILSGAADSAADRVRTKILEIAAHLLEAAVEDLEIEAGRISVVGTPAKATSITEVARLAYLNPAGLPRGHGDGARGEGALHAEGPVHVVELVPRLPRARSTRGPAR